MQIVLGDGSFRDILLGIPVRGVACETLLFLFLELSLYRKAQLSKRSISRATEQGSAASSTTIPRSRVQPSDGETANQDRHSQVVSIVDTTGTFVDGTSGVERERSEQSKA